MADFVRPVPLFFVQSEIALTTEWALVLAYNPGIKYIGLNYRGDGVSAYDIEVYTVKSGAAAPTVASIPHGKAIQGGDCFNGVPPVPQDVYCRSVSNQYLQLEVGQ